MEFIAKGDYWRPRINWDSARDYTFSQTMLAVPIRWNSRPWSICEPSTSSPPAMAHAHACFADDCIAFQQSIWKCQLASNLLAALGLLEPVTLKETSSTLAPEDVCQLRLSPVSLIHRVYLGLPSGSTWSKHTQRILEGIRTNTCKGKR